MLGACVEETVPSLGRWDKGITNLKLSKPKLCSQKRELSFFFGFQVADVMAGKCVSLDAPHSFCQILSFGCFCGNTW